MFAAGPTIFSGFTEAMDETAQGSWYAWLPPGRDPYALHVVMTSGH